MAASKKAPKKAAKPASQAEVDKVMAASLEAEDRGEELDPETVLEADQPVEELDPPPGAEEGGAATKPTPVGDEAAPPVVSASIYNPGFPVVVEHAGAHYDLPERAVTKVPLEVADHVVGPGLTASGTHSLRGCVRVAQEVLAEQIAAGNRAWERHLEKNPRLVERE